MLFSRSLRKGEVVPPQPKGERDAPQIVLVLDDVYDTFNVGGMYRIADAAGVSHIYHCGGTPLPPNPKIARASVGLYQYIPYSHEPDIMALIVKLRSEGYAIVSLEQNERSVDYATYPYRSHTALVAGNETFGVRPEVLASSDGIVELPMYGINKSVNVVVATGIVLYQIRRTYL